MKCTGQGRPSPVSVMPVCVSCVSISCLASSCLNGSQKWLGCTDLLSQPPLGMRWQRSQGQSFNSEIKWETCYLPFLLAIQWDPEDQASPRPEQSINQVKCHKARRRLGVEVLLESLNVCVWLCVCKGHEQCVWMSLCDLAVRIK